MAKNVIWSLRAQDDRKYILSYWIKRNKSKTYAQKLNQQFKEACRLLPAFLKIGKLTDEEHVRIKIIRDYFII